MIAFNNYDGDVVFRKLKNKKLDDYNKIIESAEKHNLIKYEEFDFEDINFKIKVPEIEFKVESKISNMCYGLELKDGTKDENKYLPYYSYERIHLTDYFKEISEHNDRYNTRQFSTTKYVNTYIALFKYNLLPDYITNVYTIQQNSYKTFKNSFYKNRICFLLDNYGYTNNLFYEIGFDKFFKLDFKYLSYGFKYNFKNLTGIEIDNISKEKLKYKLYDFIYKFHKEQYEKTPEGIEELNRIREKEYNKSIKKIKPQIAYILKDKSLGYYKIGKSCNPLQREKTLQAEKPSVKLVKVFKDDCENELHNKYKKQRVRGEWFDLNKVQVKYICKHYK